VAKADTIEFVPSVGGSNPPELVQPGDESGQATTHKLQAIIIPKVLFAKMDVTGVLNFLAYKSKQLDPDKKGINFVLGSFQHRIT
jgi:hypothetical protein